MKNCVFPASCLAGLSFLLAGFARETQAAPSSEYPTPRVREEQKVMVDGVNETWRLQWMTNPKTECEPNQDSLYCQCTGFGSHSGLGLVIHCRRQVSLTPSTITFCSSRTLGVGYSELGAACVSLANPASRKLKPAKQLAGNTQFFMLK